MPASILPKTEALVAPARLVSETRAEFRKDALALVAQATERGKPEVLLDLGATTEIDASGLGILVLVQKAAKDAGVMLRLASVSAPVAYLLRLTHLDRLFPLTSAAA